MSRFRFSKRSNKNLIEVDTLLQMVADKALSLTEVDFGVICGMRTAEEQAELRRIGASQVKRSKHQDGLAIDVAAFVGSQLHWELPFYFKIADAFRLASIELKIPVRWGGAWHRQITSAKNTSCSQLCDDYVAMRRKQGRKPFIDAGHFELV